MFEMPDNADAHLNRGIAALLAGDFVSGWASYDRRLVQENVKQPKPVGPPVWGGESIAGKSIFVYDEQGMGDIIQFCRYLPGFQKPARM